MIDFQLDVDNKGKNYQQSLFVYCFNTRFGLMIDFQFDVDNKGKDYQQSRSTNLVSEGVNIFHHHLRQSNIYNINNASMVLNFELCIYWHDNTHMRTGSQWCNVPYESVKRQFI